MKKNDQLNKARLSVKEMKQQCEDTEKILANRDDVLFRLMEKRQEVSQCQKEKAKFHLD